MDPHTDGVRRIKFPAGVLLAAAAVLGINGRAAADSRTPGKVIAGYVEKLTLKPWNHTVSAKLDTGALTSSIHATDVERFKKDGEKWVRFTLDLEDTDDNQHSMTVERPLERRVKIKEDDDDHDRRLVVKLDICFDGREHAVQFTLNDRSNYLYQVLLGRRFLKDVAIVDPSASFLTQRNCPPIEP